MYFVTSVSKASEEDKRLGFHFGGTRCWAYYCNKNDAFSCVQNNETDIWETVYDFAVVEQIAEGILPRLIERWWFEFDIEKREFRQVECPFPAFERFHYPQSIG